MKRNLSLFLLFIFSSGIFLFHILETAHAQNILSSATTVNMSDAIYADLAVRGYLDNVSLQYTDGNAANDIKLNETRHWLPASTVKTFAAMYAYKLIGLGKIHLFDMVTIDAKNSVTTELVTDALPTLLIGEEVTIDRLIRQMIIQSDNTAFNQLLDILGRDNITEYIQSLGLTHSHVGSKLNLDDSQTQYEYDISGYGVNTTTAEDYAKAFMLIKTNRIPGAKDLFSILKQQKLNNMIPLFLPKTVVCAHKTGDLDPLYHDGGICQDNTHSYVLTIFTNAGNPTLLAHLSEIVYTKNYQLVGQSLPANQPITDNINQPVDSLVLNPSKTSVLGASTQINFPVPDITAADLGIQASDLSLILSNDKLPKVVIPADSPFHILSDAWQFTLFLASPGPQERMTVNLETEQLKIAEAKDLIRRGKSGQGQALLASIQQRLNYLSKDSTVQSDPATQTSIQAISETRFAVLGEQLQKTSGNEKLALIKEIAAQAKATIQQVQPNIPEAINATSPTQRPLIGTVIKSTPTDITMETAGGQQITVPASKNAAIVQQMSIVSPVPVLSGSTTGTPTPFPSIVPQANTMAIGTTIALIGSTINNHFSPSFILTNLPKELAAPEPVIVAKVDTKHNTMVVQENGVYRQVNITKDTTIKGADTNIPLKSIQAGDVVIVHGAPATQDQPRVPSVVLSVTPTAATQTSQPTFSQKNSTESLPNVPVSHDSSNPPTHVPTVPANSNIQSRTIPAVSLPATKQIPVVPQPATLIQGIAPVIQGKSIQVIEKKLNIPATPSQITQPKPEQKTPSQPQPQSQSKSVPPPAQISISINTNNQKKK